MISETKYLKNKKLLALLSTKQLRELQGIEEEAIARFEGDIGVLCSALGFLRLGHQVGWRVLVITHSRRTVKKYEELLGIDVKELFPEEAAGAERSLGLKFAKTLTNFWRAAGGDIKVENRREIT